MLLFFHALVTIKFTKSYMFTCVLLQISLEKCRISQNFVCLLTSKFFYIYVSVIFKSDNWILITGFLFLQILTFTDREIEDLRQGRMLLHTEYSLLSSLHGMDGIVRKHALFTVRTLLWNIAINCILNTQKLHCFWYEIFTLFHSYCRFF